MVHTLNNILFEGFRRFVPFYVREKRDIKCPWNNAALRKLKNKKNKEWKKFKSTGNKLLYETAFLNYDQLNTVLYNNYISRVKSNLKSNPNSFWNFVNSRGKSEFKPKSLWF